MNIEIYQIFYDEKTRNIISSDCIGLDNTNPTKQGWFEFYPMLNCLKEKIISDNVFYGFLSPNFELKTGLSIKKLINTLRARKNLPDVFISNYCWDQTAYFKNAWDQGELWHPGILESTQKFLNFCGFKTDLNEIIGCSTNTVASNYIIAKGSYWKIWLDIAEKFETYLTTTKEGAALSGLHTTYAVNSNLQKMGVFIQERFASFILATNEFRVDIFDSNEEKIVFERIFKNTEINKIILNECDQLKKIFLDNKDSRLLESWLRLRSAIQLNIDALR